MKTKLKPIIIVLAIVVVLCGVLAFLLLTEPKDDDNSQSDSSMESSLIYDKNPDDVTEVSVTNSTDSFDVKKDGTNYKVEGYENLPLNEGYISTLFQSVASITAKKTVEENATDLAKYGLDSSATQVSVTFGDSDKTVKSFRIGGEAFKNGQSYFVMDGEKTVYAVDSTQFTGVNQSKTNLLSYTLLDKPETDDKYPVIDKVTIYKKNADYPVEIQYDKSLVDPDYSDYAYDNVHMLTSPVKQRLSKQYATVVVRGLFGLSATSVYKAEPTDDDYKETGLDDPYCTYTMETGGKVYRLYLGNKTDDKQERCYGYFEGRDIIYVFDNVSVAFAQASASSIVSKSVTTEGIYDLNKIELITDKNNVKVDLSGNHNDEFIAKIDGKEIDKSLVQSFYYFFTKTPCNELYLDEPSTDICNAKIILTDRLNNETVIEYYDNGYRKSVIKFNGVSAYTTDTSYVERLVANIELFADGKDIVSEW